MKYYKLGGSYYPRDVFFSFSDNNRFEKSDLEKCVKLDAINERVEYVVDKLDKNIDKYDILPTIGAPLVSARLKVLIEQISLNDCQFIPAVIKDDFNQINENYYAMNILNCVECLDKEKSTYGPLLKSFPEGPIKITDLFFQYKKLENYCIVKMQESKIIVVNSVLFENCKKNKINGILFVCEGNQLSPTFANKVCCQED